MKKSLLIKTSYRAGCIALLSACATLANGTIVQFQTSLGDFEVNLYDQAVPQTVANFLAYVDAGAYDNSVIHRLAKGFVVQGGGFYFSEPNQLEPLASPWSPPNEPVYANVRRTIAMAKLGGDPDSATNQWFFNLGDNRSNLDNQNGGFTVFGEVVGDGMAVVDAIAALDAYNLSTIFTEAWGSALSSAPLHDATTPEAFLADMAEYFVVISNIVVIDADVATAAALTPVLSSATGEETPDEVVTPPKKKKGGALPWFLLALTASLGLSRRRSIKSIR